jgi:regulator of CtrA degradation
LLNAFSEAYIMSDKSVSEVAPVSFGQKLASSQTFAALFREGMGLVEETAAYLDGPGRQQSKKLERSAALVYATESMRLTTRLMQLASWLLLHRAVNEGEMSLAQANKEKTKVKLSISDSTDEDAVKLLPERLSELIEQSRMLLVKVRRLDATIHAPVPDQPTSDHPLNQQLGLLKAAFERDGN